MKGRVGVVGRTDGMHRQQHVLHEILDVGTLQEGAAMPDDLADAHGQLLHQRGIRVGIAALRGPHQGRETLFVGFGLRHLL